MIGDASLLLSSGIITSYVGRVINITSILFNSNVVGYMNMKVVYYFIVYAEIRYVIAKLLPYVKYCTWRRLRNLEIRVIEDR